jgi:hypothetical protein
VSIQYLRIKNVAVREIPSHPPVMVCTVHVRVEGVAIGDGDLNVNLLSLQGLVLDPPNSDTFAVSV